MHTLFAMFVIAAPAFAQPPERFEPPRPGTLLPGFLRDQLKLTPEQKKKLDELQKDADKGSEAILTKEQKKTLEDLRVRGPFPGGFHPQLPQTEPAPPRKIKKVEATETNIRKAVEKALPTLWTALEGYNDVHTCFACHHHGTALVAFGIARTRGYDIPEKKLQAQIDFLAADLERNQKNYEKGRGPGPAPAGGETDNTCYQLLAFDAIGYKPSKSTETLISYTLGNQKSRDNWFTPADRAPTEGSSFTTTALNIRGIQAYRTKDQKAVADKRIDAAKGWLVKTAAKDNEDRVFRLIGLVAAKAESGDIEQATEDLVKTQREDGGWRQTDSMASDPYATATALYALQTAGGLKVDDAAIRKGVAFLLGTQEDDGTWFVKTHSKPVQRYFESGFPHGKDQFISCAATGWATAVLALATPSKK